MSTLPLGQSRMAGGEDSADFNEARAEVFEAISHPARIKILQTLNEKPMGFAQLGRAVGIEGGGHLSFHLRKLVHLVKMTPEGTYALTGDGKEALWSINALRKSSNGTATTAREKLIRRRNLAKPILGGALIALVATISIFGVYFAETSSQISSLQSANTSLQSQVQSLHSQIQDILSREPNRFSVNATISLSNGSLSMAINPVTNRIYMAGGCAGIAVIDGSSNSVVTCIHNTGGYSLAVNPRTNEIYALAYEDTTVDQYGIGSGPTSVITINGSTNTVKSNVNLAFGQAPCWKDVCSRLAVNPNTNRVYVASFWSNSVIVLDGSSDRVIGNITVGVNPTDVVIDASTNRIYVGNYGSDSLSVIDGTTEKVVGTISLGGASPFALALNPITHRIYVSTGIPPYSFLGVVDESNGTLLTTIALPDVPNYLGVNPNTNVIFVPLASSNYTLAIDGSTNKVLDRIYDASNQTATSGYEYHGWEAVVNTNDNLAYFLWDRYMITGGSIIPSDYTVTVVSDSSASQTAAIP